jgi:hypothetical protein
VRNRFLALLVAALPLFTPSALALAQGTPPAGKSNNSAQEQLQRVPMVFYLAKGEANACGEGCNEWIAADGYIDLGSAQRLRSLLDRYSGRNLPVYFASPGGLLDDALAIGRLLRERGMTAGIANTVPFGCIPATDKNKEACRALKQSNGEIPAELRSMGASCNSACVYTLLGAKIREIPPGAHLGVHSGRLVRVSDVDGRVKAGPQNRSQASQKAKTAEFEAQIRSYTSEMGVDPGLIDMALKIPFAQMHYLSRAEIAGYGIDTRGFQETRWTTANTSDAALAVFKVLTEARGSNGKELRASVIRLACFTPTEVILAYVRGLASNEVGQSTSIQMSLGDRSLTLPRAGRETKINAIDAGATFDTRFISAPIEFFEAAAAAGESIDITETGPRDGSRPGRVSKLSTVGLRGALKALRQQCGGGPVIGAGAVP